MKNEMKNGCLAHVPPREEKTRVRIPAGCKVFRENVAVLLCSTDVICIALCWEDIAMLLCSMELICIVCVLKKVLPQNIHFKYLVFVAGRQLGDVKYLSTQFAALFL
jgi:hypothetical protein